MGLTIEQKIYYGDNVFKVSGDENVEVYRMEDATGEGMMTCYHVLPGIDLMYNDFHMQSCISQAKPKIEMISFDHCREGRIEWQFENGSYLYLQQGDMQITTKERHDRLFGFPLSHYHGITIAVYIEEATQTLAGIIGGVPVDLRSLKSKFCTGEKPFIMRASDPIQHLFSELYHVPDKIRFPYFKIKVLELLLFLGESPVPQGGEERPYFSKTHVGTVKAICRFMTQNTESHYTLEELSHKFHIPLTSMKNCFKGVYGTSVYTYMRTYRMQTAAFLLRQTHQSIISIAANVGYSNPSKFSAAFKEIMGVSPIRFRKTLV